MSFKEKNEPAEQVFDQKSSGSEDNYETDEEIDSGESFSEPLINFKNIFIDKNRAVLKIKKNTAKRQLTRRTVPLKYRKYNRHFGAQIKPTKPVKGEKYKKPSKKNKASEIKAADIPKKGKRCLLGGKAKGKQFEEGNSEKHGSDDDSDNFYIGRISLGYFQKFKDKSGASTSNQWEEDRENSFMLHSGDKTRTSNSEELQLLELQTWGKTGLISSGNRKSDGLEGAGGL